MRSLWPRGTCETHQVIRIIRAFLERLDNLIERVRATGLLLIVGGFPDSSANHCFDVLGAHSYARRFSGQEPPHGAQRLSTLHSQASRNDVLGSQDHRLVVCDAHQSATDRGGREQRRQLLQPHGRAIQRPDWQELFSCTWRRDGLHLVS
jgi:hypothetical protein